MAHRGWWHFFLTTDSDFRFPFRCVCVCVLTCRFSFKHCMALRMKSSFFPRPSRWPLPPSHFILWHPVPCSGIPATLASVWPLDYPQFFPDLQNIPFIQNTPFSCLSSNVSCYRGLPWLGSLKRALLVILGPIPPCISFLVLITICNSVIYLVLVNCLFWTTRM